MSTATLRARNLLPLDWPTFTWLPLGGPAIRIEEFLDGDDYVVRAEIPGVDPAKDVRVTFADGALSIRVERAEQGRAEDGKVAHSEFHYGSLYRQIPLPAGARTDQATATYEAGILEVRIAIGVAGPRTHEIPVVVSDGKPVTGKS